VSEPLDLTDLDAFEPFAKKPQAYGPEGIISDGFTATTRYQLSEVRNYGRALAVQYDQPSVRFRVQWVHQFETVVTVDRNGFLIDHPGLDLSADQHFREVKEIHG